MKMKTELEPEPTADASPPWKRIVMLPEQEEVHYCAKVEAVKKGWADDEGYSIDEIRCTNQCFWCKQAT